MSANLELTFDKDLTQGNIKTAMKGTSSAELWNVDPAKLKFMDNFNARTQRPEYLAHLKSIKESIRENGFYKDKPIGVFVAIEDGQQVLYVTDGHTRTRAVQELIEEGHKIETVPVATKPRGTTMEDLTVALVKSNEGLPLTPYEIGVVCKRLQGMGLEEKTIAKRLGYTLQYVNDLLGLVGAPKAIRDMVVAGQVSATAAVKEIKQHGPKAVLRLQEGLQAAQAAGKTKVTGKHIGKKPGAAKVTSLKLNGLINIKHIVGQTFLKIELNEALEVELLKGDKVRLVIVQGDVDDL